MNKAIFLDRDGVINVDTGYVGRWEDFSFTPEIFVFCQKAVEKGYKLIVVTNQSGIGRGFFQKSDFLKLNGQMLEVFLENNIEITDVFYCPYHPTDGVGEYKQESLDRKPQPGMLLKAISKHRLDSEQCILIGDSERDIEAARAAGVLRTYLIKNTSELLNIINDI